MEKLVIARRRNFSVGYSQEEILRLEKKTEIIEVYNIYDSGHVVRHVDNSGYTNVGAFDGYRVYSINGKEDIPKELRDKAKEVLKAWRAKKKYIETERLFD